LYDFILVTSVYQGVDGITCWCVEKAHQAGLNFLWVPGSGGKGDALICRSRSVAATAFMESGASNYMIFLDSDIMFNPEHLKKLNEHQKAGYDIVGGIYPLRSGTGNSTYFFKNEVPEDLGVHECQFLATGFMGISKYALQKIAKEYKYPDGKPLPILHPETEGARSYPFFETGWMRNDTPDCDGTLDIWLSEDWDFCQKARAVGFKIYADTSIQVGHQGNRIVTFKDVAEYKAKYAQLMQQEGSVEEPPPDYVGKSTEGADA